MSLVKLQHVVTVDPKIAERAVVPIQRMLEIA
jgi:quinolinate synthase